MTVTAPLISELEDKIRGIDADMGGTEILGALNFVFSKQPKTGIPRNVFLLSDGAVSATEEVMQNIARNARNMRFHAFGIGS